SISQPVLAQPRECVADNSLVPWLNVITSNFVDGGASEDGAGGFDICSTAPGPGAEMDSNRMLVQSASGDFELQVTLESLTSGGSGGLAVTLTGLNLVTAPRLLVWVEADHLDATTGWLHSSLRSQQDETADPEPAALAVNLPLRLYVSRSSGVLSSGFIEGNVVTNQLTADVSGGQLANEVRIGMLQFSGDAQHLRWAHFERPELDIPKVSKLDCTDGDPLLGPSPFALVGENMDSWSEVRAFGNRAAILEQTERQLLVQPAAPDGGVNYGQIKLFGPASQAPLVVEIAAIGQPFTRGDANLDGKVDFTDLRALTAWLRRGQVPACPGAGDVNGDGYTNLADEAALQAWLAGTGRPPAWPFPEPGYVEGAQTCGAPAAPEIRSSRPERLGRKRPLMQGDVIDLTGKDLPPPSELAIWFGDVRTRVLGGDRNSLRVRVGQVPEDGYRCARIIDVKSQSQESPLRVGGGWLAREDSRKFCYEFQAGAADGPAFASRVSRDGHIEISIPRADWQPGRLYDIQASAFMPWLDGLSQGSRELRMSFRAPTGGEDSYAHGLESLAVQMTAAMNGGYLPTTPCDCELDVEAQPLAEKLILAPCFPPPPKPEPIVPGPNEWQAPPPDLVGGVIIKANNPPPVECDGGFVSHKDDPRRAAWCNFQDIVQTMDEESFDPPVPGYIGHPKFASWRPLTSMLIWPPYTPWTIDPDQQSVTSKHILFEPEAYHRLSDMGYSDPRVWALRKSYCFGFEGNWMPKIDAGRRVVKTFFIAESNLPSSVSTNGLYSYIPPCPEDEPNCQMERHYLVGLHLAISTLHDYGSRPEGYFWWATFWVPAIITDIHTKSGADLQWFYSQSCVVGNGVDRPVNLAPPWNRFVMCTDADPDESTCGNPYAPGECPLNGGSTSCKGCHDDNGTVSFDTPGIANGSLEMGWLPSLSLALSEEELDQAAHYIDDHPGEFTKWTEPRENPNNPDSPPVNCDKANVNLWNPFDPQAQYPDEGP
ncbi:MAG: dockerin type I repeat-containing protein, partial [Lysobacterales bacterium]